MTRVQQILSQAAMLDGAGSLTVIVDRASRAYDLPPVCYFRALDMCVRRGYLGRYGPGWKPTALGMGVLRDGEPTNGEGGEE